MAHTIPAEVRTAIADPKVAATSSLESALSFYADDIDPAALDIMQDEFARRGGDREYMGMTNSWEPPSYDYMG